MNNLLVWGEEKCSLQERKKKRERKKKKYQDGEKKNTQA